MSVFFLYSLCLRNHLFFDLIHYRWFFRLLWFYLCVFKLNYLWLFLVIFSCLMKVCSVEIDLKVACLFDYWWWAVQSCMNLYWLYDLFMLSYINNWLFNDDFMKTILGFFSFDVALMKLSYIFTHFLLWLFHFLQGNDHFSLFLMDNRLFLLIWISAL